MTKPDFKPFTNNNEEREHPNKLVRALVLAGGKGTRLRPLSFYFQKCMIPIGHKQKPLLEYIIRLLKHHGVTDISLLVGYKHEQIVNYFNNGKRFDVNITYVLDESKLGGTGGSLLNVYQKGSLDSSEVLIVYYGDIISDINLTEMMKQHQKREAAATLALSKGFKVRVGVAEVNRGDVICWTEKPTLPINVGIGILILNASVLQEFVLLSNHYPELDIMNHIIPHLLEKGQVVHAYVSDTFWYDVGSAEAYEKLDNHFIEKHLEYLLT